MLAAKRRAMDAFVDRYFPGRSRVLREPNAQEIKATSFLSMPIDEASAKIRDVPPHDEEADYAVPAWTALLPIRTVFGEAQECERQHPDADRTAGGIDPYRAGRTLDAVFAETAALYGAADPPD